MQLESMSADIDTKEEIPIGHLDESTFKDGIQDAQVHSAEVATHEETVWEALRAHPQSVLWTIVIASTIIMEGYDNNLIQSMYALPAFQDRYGTYYGPTAGTQIPANWQTALSQASNIGAFIGILCCGQIVDRFGYRRTMLGALFLMIGVIFIVFFAPSLAVLFVGELACGIPWGFYNNVASAYASEVAPLALRSILTTYIQLCWCIGSLISSGVMYKMAFRADQDQQWGYKIPFAVQWVWPPMLIVGIFLAPESPWWLVRKGRLAESEKVLARLGTARNMSTSDAVALMVRTNEIELASTEGASYLACFKGVNLRRTLIVCICFAVQLLSGAAVGASTTYFMEVAGLAPTKAFALGMGSIALQTAGVGACWILSSYFGRRTLYLWGVGFGVLACTLVGILASIKQTSTVLYAQGALAMLIYGEFGLTTGPLTYAIIAETSSVRLRAKSVALARASYYLTAIPAIFVSNYSLNPAAWGLAGKFAFIWVGTGVVVWILAYFGLPECKGRSYRELDVLFNNKISARRFVTTNVDELAEI